MQRQKLKALISFMFAVVIVGFIYVLLSSLGTPIGLEPDVDKFSDVNSGQTVMRRVNGKRVWLTRLSAEQIEQRNLLNPLLVNPKSGCSTNKPICAVLALVSDNGLELSYTVASPPQLEPDADWFGGFVDPTTGAVFDLHGRAYRLNRASDEQTLQSIVLD